MRIGDKYKIAKIEMQTYENGLIQIMKYLNSDKFNGPNFGDDMVNRKDIINYINGIRANVGNVLTNAEQILAEFPKAGDQVDLVIDDREQLVDIVQVKGDQVKIKYFDKQDNERFMFKDFWEI